MIFLARHVISFSFKNKIKLTIASSARIGRFLFFFCFFHWAYAKWAEWYHGIHEKLGRAKEVLRFGWFLGFISLWRLFSLIVQSIHQFIFKSTREEIPLAINLFSPIDRTIQGLEVFATRHCSFRARQGKLVRGCVKVDLSSRSIPYLRLIGFLLCVSFLLTRICVMTCHSRSWRINLGEGAQSRSGVHHVPALNITHVPVFQSDIFALSINRSPRSVAPLHCPQTDR